MDGFKSTANGTAKWWWIIKVLLLSWDNEKLEFIFQLKFFFYVQRLLYDRLIAYPKLGKHVFFWKNIMQIKVAVN